MDWCCCCFWKEDRPWEWSSDSDDDQAYYDVESDELMPKGYERFTLPEPIHHQLFGDDYGWFILPIAKDGHCFFRAFGSAYNTHPTTPPESPLTVAQLRAWIANAITPQTFSGILYHYNSYLKTPLVQNVEQLQAFVQTGQHFATREDIAIIQQHLPNAYPLIINFHYTGIMENAYPLVALVGFPKKFQEGFYILLMHDGSVDHFELVCKTQCRIAHAGMDVEPWYRAVFAWNELPLSLQEKALTILT